MLTAVGFVLIGVLWLTFRKRIARRQHQILMQMMGRSQELIRPRSMRSRRSELDSLSCFCWPGW